MRSIIIISILLFFGCSGRIEDKKLKAIESLDSTGVSKTDFPVSRQDDWLQLVGDFNGNGVVDTLTEMLVSSIDNQELKKNHEGIDYDSMVSLAAQKKPLCRLVASDKRMRDLEFSSKTRQLLGISYLKNEGDIDQNGTDEIGLVIDWADWSDTNSYMLYSYCGMGWQRIASFEINEFDMLKDSTSHFVDTTFQGFLHHNSMGQLVASIYEQGERKETILDLGKICQDNN